MTVRATALVLCSIAACAEKVSPLVDAPPAVVDARPDAAPLANIPDDGFGTHGSVAFAATCQAFALDASDRSLVVTTTADPVTLSRYTSAGTLDPTFGTGGNVAVTPTPFSAFSAFTLASGKIVVLGELQVDATHFPPHLYRFTSDGTPDLDIELPTTVYPRAVVAHERADGELELVTWGTSSAFDVVRITAAGALDSAFGTNGVAVLDTPGEGPGYFPHGVAVADGTFILSGASFGQAPGMGVGPVNGHLFRVVDGTVTANVQTDNAQYLSVVTDGVQPFVLVNSLPDHRATIAAIDATTLKYDPGTGLTLPFPIAANYGTFSGAALSIRSGTELFVNMPDMTTTMLARYREDNAHDPGGYGTVADHSGYCGSALDSQTRPVFATQTTLYRFTP